MALAKAKADLILRAYRRVGYDAVLPGEGDFSAGFSYLRQRGEEGIPLTCLNLVSARSGKPVFPPFRTVSRGGMRILVTGLIAEDVFPKGALSGLQWKVALPRAALAELLAGKEAAGADLVVVLTHIGRPGDVALARGINRPLLILGAHSEDPFRAPVFESGAAIFQPRKKATHLLEVSVGRTGGAERNDRADFADTAMIAQYKLKRSQLLDDMKGMDAKRRKIYEKAADSLDNAIRIALEKRPLQSRMVPLSSRIPDDPEIAAMVAGYKTTIARIAKRANRAERRSGDYLGHAACSGCHEKNFAAWRNEAHSRAVETLKKLGDDGNPDCLGCHATGYRKGGFVLSSPGGSKEFAGVGCEACHGPGRGHPGRRMSIPGEKSCTGCHGGLGPFPFSEKRRLLGCVDKSGGSRVEP